jgi:hypothetical protein
MTSPPCKRRERPTDRAAIRALIAEIDAAMHDPLLHVVSYISFARTQQEAAAILEDNRHLFAQLTPEQRQLWLAEIDELINEKPVLDED